MTEYQKFTQWYIATFGSRYRVPSESTYRNTTIYRDWKASGEPTKPDVGSVRETAKATDSYDAWIKETGTPKSNYTRQYWETYVKDNPNYQVGIKVLGQGQPNEGEISGANITTAPTTDSGKRDPYVQSVDGYDYLMVWSDETGKYEMQEYLGRSRDTAAEQTQQAIQNAQNQTNLNNQQWMAQQTAIANAQQREANYWASQSQTRESDIRRAEQERMAQEFEKWRGTILSGTAPRDWVIREKAKSAANPFVVDPQSISEAAGKLQEELKTAEAREKAAKQNFDSVARRVTDSATIVDKAEIDLATERYNRAVNARTNIEKRLDDYGAMTAIAQGREADVRGLWENGESAVNPDNIDWSYWGTKQDVLEELEAAQPVQTATGGWSVGRASAPEVRRKPELPTGIKPYVYGGEFGGEIARPSAGQLASMDWSAREQLLGYQEGLGLQANDLLSQIEKARPNYPSLGNRWVARR